VTAAVSSAVAAPSSTRLCAVLLAVVAIALAVSAIHPHDWLTWLLRCCLC
jgi:hypothetical protein